MGLTALDEGSVPAHTRERSMEIYYYFEFPEDQIEPYLFGGIRHGRCSCCKSLDGRPNDFGIPDYRSGGMILVATSVVATSIVVPIITAFRCKRFGGMAGDDHVAALVCGLGG